MRVTPSHIEECAAFFSPPFGRSPKGESEWSEQDHEDAEEPGGFFEASQGVHPLTPYPRRTAGQYSCRHGGALSGMAASIMFGSFGGSLPGYVVSILI